MLARVLLSAWLFSAVAAGAAAQEISPLQVQLAAWCGAKWVVSGTGQDRLSSGECSGNRQLVMLAGPAEKPVALQAQVDLRHENIARSRQLLVSLARELLDDRDAPEAERFVSIQLGRMVSGESAERRFGGYTLRLTRNSDVMATLVVAKGTKATHRAFEW